MQHVHDIAAPAARSGSFFADLFETFTPRRQCMNLEADVIWLHVASDSLIVLAYWSIPVALFWFVRRRKDLAFDWMFVLFALFIFLCGTTHLFGVWAIWQPLYRLDGVVKLLTGAVSMTTAVLLWKLIPTAVALPSPAQLRVANDALQAEIDERRLAEQRTAELASELEQRVEQRTRELAQRNRALRAEAQAREAAEDERNELLLRERAARAEAERLNRVKDEFLATLSHELRTPLNAIFGWSQILREGRSSDEDRRRGLEVIERNARAQTRMVEDLLDMSRVISGKLRLELAPVDLVPSVAAAVETVRPTAEAKGLSLATHLDPTAGVVRGDASRLQQIAWNLLSNAIKFTPRGGSVEVSLAREGSQAVLRVHDDGAGIEPAFLPHVFERFRQADATTTRLHGGLGLGLSLVRTLVELHGSTVDAASEGRDRGATFRVRLPIAPTAATRPAKAPLAPVAGTQPLAGRRVLVVDDEADARELLRHVLEEHGAEVLALASAEEALEALEGFRPDLLVSDVGMPRVDGYELLRRVRATPGFGRLPALALTALARAEDRQEALAAGFDQHVAKPVEPTLLVASVARLAARP